MLARVVEAVLLFGEVLAAAAGSDDHADAAQLVARHGARGRARHPPRASATLATASGTARENVRPVLDLDVLLLVELVGTSPATCTW